MKTVTVVEKVKTLNANAPIWEIYVDNHLVDSTFFPQYIKALVTYHSK